MYIADTRILAFVLVGGAAVLTATLYGVAALWAMRGPTSWLWRCAPLTLLLAALAPIGAYELIAMYGTEAIIIIAGLWIGPRLGQWRTARHARDRLLPNEAKQRLPRAASIAPQFHLSDLAKATVLAGAVLAIVRYAAPSSESFTWSIESWPWLAAGAGMGVVTVAAARMAWGSARWYIRLFTTLIIITAVAGPLEWLQATSRFFSSDYFQLTEGWWASLIALQDLLTVSLLLLVRRASDASKASPGRFRHWTARCTLAGIVLITVCWLGSPYRALLPPAVPPLEPLPVPNGYDDLVRAGKSLNWAAVSSQDPEEATDQACQAFVQANAGSLLLARQGLTRPCQCPLDFTYAAINIGNFSSLRDVCRAFCIEAKAAAGQPHNALRIHLDIVRLARDVSRGGLAVDDLVADAIQGTGLRAISQQLNKFDAVSLKSLQQTLEAMSNSREPLAAILERESIWSRLAMGWTGRLYHWLDEVVGYNETLTTGILNARTRCDVRMRLLIAEAAVRRHVLVEGSPPESLESLVPEYLTAVPSDPHGDGPLVYRRTADGYLLYSVGENRTDDGGQRVSFREARPDEKGDLFFDSGDEIADAAAEATNGADR